MCSSDLIDEFGHRSEESPRALEHVRLEACSRRREELTHSTMEDTKGWSVQ